MLVESNDIKLIQRFNKYLKFGELLFCKEYENAIQKLERIQNDFVIVKQV